MTCEEALAALESRADPAKAAEMAAYHKVARPYLGVAVPEIDTMARDWRETLSLDDRIRLARELWDTNIHEARVTAARLFTQARIRPDDEDVWNTITDWVPAFDAWAIADHVSAAGARRLIAHPERIEVVEGWTTSPHMWTRRAALVMTLPWTKQNFPKPQDIEIRDRVLGWCATYADDRDWFIQKAVGWWLRDLSRHDPDRVHAWLAMHGRRLKAFARKEAGRHMQPGCPDQTPGA